MPIDNLGNLGKKKASGGLVKPLQVKARVVGGCQQTCILLAFVLGGRNEVVEIR